MRTYRNIGRLVAIGVLAGTAFAVTAGAASADVGTVVCNTGAGAAHLSPGLSDTAHAQKIKLAAKLSDCSGGLSGGVVAVKFERTSDLTCAGVLADGGTLSGKVAVKWLPKHSGKSAGTVSVTLDPGAATAHISGTITKGVGKGSTFAADASVTPQFKPKGTPCTPANKLQWADITLTSPLTITPAP